MQRHATLLVILDHNAKIGEGRYNKTVGAHGLGTHNERGNRLIEFATKHKCLSQIPGLNRKVRKTYMDVTR